MSRKRGLPPLPKVLGTNGKRPCRGCGADIPPTRQTWCSNECREGHYMALSSWARRRVRDRDNGVCAECGTDTAKCERILLNLYRREDRHAFADYLQALGQPSPSYYGWHYGHLWEADHVVPLAEGGTNALDNYRTLCVPCHKQATKELAARLALRRRRQERLAL